MRIARLRAAERVAWARVVDDATAKLWTGAPWDGGEETDAEVSFDQAALLPLVTPSKIVCVGRNYRAHAAELGQQVPPEPLLFLKPPSALLAPGGAVEWPRESQRVDYEGEIAVVIGRSLRHASEAEAVSGVFGITCADDVTARDLQREDVQFTRAKGFDTFCPCGPWIETEHPPLDALVLRTRVDGELRQEGRSSEMIWGIATLLSFISGVMRLLPGDLVLTGTPEGVAPLARGSRVEIEIEGVGTLAHTVAAGP